MSETTEPRSRPVALWVLCGLLLAEAAAVAAGMVAAVRHLTQGSPLAGPLIFLMVLAAAVTALLVAALRGLWRGARWARSPMMTLQILLVALSVGWLGVEVSIWAMAALIGAVVVGVCLLLPPVVAWTTVGSSRN